MPLPHDTLATLERLRARELAAPSDLRRLVADHLEAVRAAADPFVDVDTAEQVAAACGELLRQWPTLDEQARRSVQAACLYFAEVDDGESDLHSVVGFDDDLEVVRYVGAVVEGR